MKERNEQEIVDAMRTGKLYNGSPLNPEAEVVNKTEETSMKESQAKPEAQTPAPPPAAQESTQAAPEAPQAPPANVEPPPAATAPKKKPAAPKKPKAKPEPVPATPPAPAETPATPPPAAPVAEQPPAPAEPEKPKKPAKKAPAPKPAGSKESGVASPRLTRFILNYINSAEGNQARTVDIGCAGLHSSEAVRNPMGPEESYPTPRYTAWACTPCTKLAAQGLIERVLVGSGKESGRSMIAYYRVTAAGITWLEQDRARAANSPA